jgi:hypothetical protein
MLPDDEAGRARGWVTTEADESEGHGWACAVCAGGQRRASDASKVIAGERGGLRLVQRGNRSASCVLQARGVALVTWDAHVRMQRCGYQCRLPAQQCGSLASSTSRACTQRLPTYQVRLQSRVVARGCIYPETRRNQTCKGCPLRRA